MTNKLQYSRNWRENTMIMVHEDIAAYVVETKPMECPLCGNKRAFDVPKSACVRRAKRGKAPPFAESDAVILKCKKCGKAVGLTIEN
jgi:DNA-directed RNA polymerase subunit RPC12/RpoP